MAYVTLEQAKNHLRVSDDEDDDIYIEALIDAAETAVLNEIKAFSAGAGTVTTAGSTALVGDDTTFTDYKSGDVIKVSGETNRIIDTITDDTNLTVTVAFSTSASTLTYMIESSPLESGVLPKPVYQAILLMIGNLYENREPVITGTIITKVPFALEYLLYPYKTWVVK